VWQHLNLSPIDYHPSPKIGAVGKKTAEDLRHIGANVELIADSQNAENFADMFLNHPEARSPVGLPQGDKALGTLQKKFEGQGFTVWPVVIYKTILRPQSFREVDIIVLASPSGVKALQNPGKAKLVAIGETTLRAIESKGWQAVKSESLEAGEILDVIETLARKMEKV
jgi:uroporphyrinogen-III synthase